MLKHGAFILSGVGNWRWSLIDMIPMSMIYDGLYLNMRGSPCVWTLRAVLTGRVATYLPLEKLLYILGFDFTRLARQLWRAVQIDEDLFATTAQGKTKANANAVSCWTHPVLAVRFHFSMSSCQWEGVIDNLMMHGMNGIDFWIQRKQHRRGLRIACICTMVLKPKFQILKTRT